jgi:Holliday junction resolvasome RuvABC endonuclease subunit
MSIIVGIDPSLTSAGIAILRDGHPVLLTSVGHKSTHGRDYGHRSDRIVSQCRAVLDAVFTREGRYQCHVDLAVIEGPSYGDNLPSNHDRAGLFWGLYSALRAKRVPTAVVAPATRSKWATGHGRASKADVLAAVRTWWPDVPIANHDVADSAVLAAMGALHHGELPWEPRNYQRNGLDSVNWPEGARK